MIGKIIAYTGSTIPEHFLACDGSAVSRTTYSALFSVIGTAYGAGDGSTTFNLPDLSGRVVIGESAAHVLASTGGESSHTLIDFPSHSHSVPAHGHGNDFAFETPSLAHSITTQPSFTYTRLNGTSNGIRQLGSGYNGRSNASMSKTTGVGIVDHAASACTMSGAIEECDEMSTSPSGTSDPHNNLMPYIALVFLIQAEEE
jgi:microcystin-dependent protein